MKNREEEQYQKHVETSSGDYTVKKSRVANTVIKIVTFLAAILIWLYFVQNNDATQEKVYDLIPIELQGTQSMSNNGLAVYSMSFDTINVTLTGSGNALKSVDRSDISAYIDLSDVMAPGEYDLTVKVKVPSGFAPPTYSDTVTVHVDKLAVKTFTVDSSNINVSSWSLEEFCVMDLENSSVNINYVTVRAPTSVLSLINDVRISSNTTITSGGNHDSSATVVFVDENGEEIVDNEIKYTLYSGGSVDISGVVTGGQKVATPSVSVVLVKEKTVPLTVTDSEGFISSDRIIMTPSVVTIKGSPEAVNAISEMSLGTFSSKNLVDPNKNYTDLVFEYLTLPDGITGVYDSSGREYQDGKINAKVRVNTGKGYALNVPAEYVTFVGGNARLASGFVTVYIRSVTDDDTYFLLLEQMIMNGQPGINLVVNLTGINVTGRTEAPVTVIFSSEFSGKLYEIYTEEDTPYTATVMPVG